MDSILQRLQDALESLEHRLRRGDGTGPAPDFVSVHFETSRDKRLPKGDTLGEVIKRNEKEKTVDLRIVRDNGNINNVPQSVIKTLKKSAKYGYCDTFDKGQEKIYWDGKNFVKRLSCRVEVDKKLDVTKIDPQVLLDLAIQNMLPPNAEKHRLQFELENVAKSEEEKKLLRNKLKQIITQEESDFATLQNELKKLTKEELLEKMMVFLREKYLKDGAKTIQRSETNVMKVEKFKIFSEFSLGNQGFI